MRSFAENINKRNDKWKMKFNVVDREQVQVK